MPDALTVPATVAPISDAPLEHLHFALKHEGLQLQAAILALKKMSGNDVAQAFENSPSSAYMRQICYLWELANGKTLEGLPTATGAYTPLFDPEKFITGPTHRDVRWRVDFNGLGSPSYCPTVRRTPEIQTLLNKDILGSASEFIASLDKTLLDQAVRWAYLSETQGSYAIENEMPTTSKAEAFSALLARAYAPERITEEYLVALQNLAVSNPLDKAVQFRTGQNWLRNALPGALGVTWASQINLVAASSLGKCPRVLRILRSLAFTRSMALVVSSLTPCSADETINSWQLVDVCHTNEINALV